MPIFSKSKTVETTAFADFIRNAPSKKKKRVFSDVMKKATERQLEVVHQAKTAK